MVTQAHSAPSASGRTRNQCSRTASARSVAARISATPLNPVGGRSRAASTSNDITTVATLTETGMKNADLTAVGIATTVMKAGAYAMNVSADRIDLDRELEEMQTEIEIDKSSIAHKVGAAA